MESVSDPVGNSVKYRLTGDPKYARVAIDWCYDARTAAERQSFIDKMNSVVGHFNAPDVWGAPGMGLEANNYYWGFLRNGLLWGVASHPKNPSAQQFIDYAMIDRWENSFKPFAKGDFRRGIPYEGPMYGEHMYAAPLFPLQTVTNYGRNLWDEVSYFKDLPATDLPRARRFGQLAGVAQWPLVVPGGGWVPELVLCRCKLRYRRSLGSRE